MAFNRHATLTPSTVMTFTLTDNSSGYEVMNRNGAGEIYISHDGTAAPANPTVGGNDFDVIPAAVGAAAQFNRASSTQNSIVVKVISVAATAVSFRSLA
jgi:hypothetical protein